MSRTMTLEELTDRYDIDALLDRYVTALDSDQFELLDQVFTPDAFLSYADAGIVGDYPSVRAMIAQHRPGWRTWLHLVGNRRVHIDGDHGTSLSNFFFAGVDNDARETVFNGGEYRDKLVRTADGWRMSERVEVLGWTGTIPAAEK